MMRYLALLIFILSLSLTALSQQRITGFIEDDETGTPVSYASVTSQKGEGVITDSAGKFAFVVRKNPRPKDSILVTAIGYFSKRVAIGDLLDNKVVRLSQKDKVLEQVKVYASLKGDYRKFGYYREWKVDNDGAEIGYIFDIPAKKVQIGRVQVKINHNYDTCWLKLHLRDAIMSGTAMPENDILKKEVIIATSIKYGLVEFDLDWEQIRTANNKLYVGFELLRCGCSQSTAPSFFFLGNEEGLNFFRESEESVWKRGGEYTIYVRMTTK